MPSGTGTALVEGAGATVRSCLCIQSDCLQSSVGRSSSFGYQDAVDDDDDGTTGRVVGDRG